MADVTVKPRADVAERSSFARTSSLSLVASLLLLGVLALLPLVLSSYLEVVAFVIFEMAALAQAWNLAGGYGGLVSLGSSAFVGIGSYAVAVLTNGGVPVVPAVLLGGVASALFAAAVSVPMLRMRGMYFAIGTLAITVAAGIFMLNWTGLGGSSGIFLSQAAPTPTQLYYAALAVAALTTAVVWALMRSLFGLRLRSVRDNEDVAQEVGVPAFWTKFWAFVISSLVMGVVGGIQALYLGAIDPTGAFSLRWTIDTVNIAIIGGSATLPGPLIGSLFVEGIGQLLANYPEIHLAISGIILIVVIRFAPQGIYGLIQGLLRRPVGVKAR